MPVPLLQTKLYISPLRSEFVPRSRLVEMLNEALKCNLTLVSAPAGFGKTTLLKEWIAFRKSPVAWVSLDSGDNDPVRFWAYIIAALQTVLDGIGETIYASLQTPQPPPIEYLITDLINEITTEYENSATSLVSGRQHTLILDDYHVITDSRVHDTLKFFVKHLPPRMNVVLSGRADPPWPLARLRARLRMVELRADDLRFTSQETVLFLNQVMGLDISPADIKALDKRTEGWIVGLQMAALSMGKRADKSGFIRAFTGTHRFILDYLLEEVLEGQPLETQEFLLKTSILERMTADLCDTILERKGSQVDLLKLEQANLFLVPLDDERCWYRYHHLFSELLKNQLNLLCADQLPGLHRRASQWFVENDYTQDAIIHAFASKDFDWTANLVEKFALDMLYQSKYNILSSWIEALPEVIVVDRPWLCVYQSWTRHWAGMRERGEDCLKVAENNLNSSAKISQDDRRILLGYIAMVRAHYALTNQAPRDAIEEAQIALQLLPEGDYFARGTAGVALGGAYWGLGYTQKAEKAFHDCASAALKGGYLQRASSALCYVGMQQVKQSRLLEAEATFQQALELVQDAEGRRYPNAGYPLAKLGELACEWNYLDQAKRDVEDAVELCTRLGHVDLIAESYAALARVQLACKDYAGVEDTLHKSDALSLETKLDPWAISWLEECRVQLWLSTGKLSEALHWVKNSGLHVEGDISYHHDMNHIILAQVMVAEVMQSPGAGEIGGTMRLLDRLLTAAETVGWDHFIIKLRLLQSLVFHSVNDQQQASEALTKGLRLAEPSGYKRVFIDHGVPMLALLEGLGKEGRSVAERGISPGYLKMLTMALGKALSPQPVESTLVEPLTPRELDVLTLLTTNMTVPEIAAELYVSPNTVRSHVKHIYEKLSVNRRLSAVQKAKELNLV